MNSKTVFALCLMLCIIVGLSNCGRKKRTGGRNTTGGSTTTTTTRSKHIQTPTRTKMDGKSIFKKCGNAVFMVFTSDGESNFQGSGFFIDPNGLAVSNYHVFQGTYQGMEQIKLPHSNIAYHIKNVIMKSEEEDFILFTVDCDKQVPYIRIAKEKPETGEDVYAIGSPRGFENTFSAGNVSQWRQKNLMQISINIDHGSSGGALINAYGEVVGITSGTFYESSQADLNYAWSIDVVKPYLKQ